MADLLDRLRFPILILLVTAIAVAGLIAYFRLSESDATVATIVPSPSQTPEKEIKVYVSGAVARPGVYSLLTSSRVEDAVKAAGGGTAEANLDAINLAVKVRDEMQVYVPKRAESSPAPDNGGTASQKISINTGSIEQLESLPGIGPVTAKRISDYRAKNGSFKSIEDLRTLKLVNSSTYDKIKDLIVP